MIAHVRTLQATLRLYAVLPPRYEFGAQWAEASLEVLAREAPAELVARLLSLQRHCIDFNRGAKPADDYLSEAELVEYDQRLEALAAEAMSLVSATARESARH